jgi:PBP1b-binding outer membrane lipoprotein LpoB
MATETPTLELTSALEETETSPERTKPCDTAKRLDESKAEIRIAELSPMMGEIGTSDEKTKSRENEAMDPALKNLATSIHQSNLLAPDTSLQSKRANSAVSPIHKSSSVTI